MYVLILELRHSARAHGPMISPKYSSRDDHNMFLHIFLGYKVQDVRACVADKMLTVQYTMIGI